MLFVKVGEQCLLGELIGAVCVMLVVEIVECYVGLVVFIVLDM